MLRGDRLKDLRQSKGYTHEELAEILDLSQKQIWRYEAGKTDPSGEIVSRIAEVFNVSSDYLLGVTDDPNPYLRVDNLSPKERQVLAAMRRGEVVEAIRVLVEYEPNTDPAKLN